MDQQKQPMTLKSVVVAGSVEHQHIMGEVWKVLSSLDARAFAMLNAVIQAAPVPGEKGMNVCMRRLAGIGLMTLLQEHVSELDALQERWNTEAGQAPAKKLILPGE